LNYLDLFSGIGGFALGAWMAGMRFEKHYFSEVDPYCVELYQKRFPDAIALGDIKEVNCEKLMADADSAKLRDATRERSVQDRILPGNNGEKRNAWIITGGFPCQDISVAGKGEGIRGSRSGLWFEYWRIIRDLRPRYAIMENVSALTFRGLTDVLGSLAEIGYDAEWQDIRAEDVGAPHRRERIWIVAYPASGNAGGGTGQQQGQESTNGESSFVLSDASGGGREAETGGDNGAEMADAATPGRRPERSASQEISQSREEQRFAGCNGGDRGNWTTEPDVGRLAHGIPHRVDRLRGLGNAIVPQIAELLFEQIKSRK
jgi:DNA (cytosine-5)-methyltransferase 1